LALSTSSEATAAYRDRIDLMLSGWPGAAEAFDAAIAANSDYVATVLRLRGLDARYVDGRPGRVVRC